MTDRLGWIDRRRLMQLLGAGGGAIAAGLPTRVFAQARKNTLVLGIDIIRKQPAEPLLTIIAAPEFVVLERKVAEANGASAAKDAKTADKAAAWINGNSCGTGAYRIAAWERNQQIQLVRNDHYWGGKPPFERIVIRHISDGAAQLLAVRRGDIDAAFNLIPEQIAALKTEPSVRLAPLASLDFVYMALTQ